MGLRDRILDFVAKWGSPTMDHPAGGGMTGEDAPVEEPESAEGESADGESPGGEGSEASTASDDEETG